MTGSTSQLAAVLSGRAVDERRIGRLVVRITYLAVALLVLGVLAMIGAGISPLDAVPTLDAAGLIAAFGGLRPEGVLWLGLMAVIATPIIRVLAAVLAYARISEWRMVAISIAILAVIAAGVVIAVLTES